MLLELHDGFAQVSTPSRPRTKYYAQHLYFAVHCVGLALEEVGLSRDNLLSHYSYLRRTSRRNVEQKVMETNRQERGKRNPRNKDPAAGPTSSR